MHYRSKDPLKHLDTGFRALKYSNGRNSSITTTTSLIEDANSAVKINSPELCEEGTGGTYFIKNQKSASVAVFKPKDEDPLSINNPKKQIISGFSGFKSGDGIAREVFAYELEPTLVPETRIVELKHPMFETTKVGSLQQFVANAESSEEYGSNMFSLSDIQEIALLDIRIVNCDRNGENLLVTRSANKEFKLHPIDHAFSLPSYTSFDNLKHFEWMNYRQSKQPIPQNLKDKIQNINIENDVALAKSVGLQSEAIVSLRIAHIILTIGAAKNKSFYDIGRFMASKGLHNLCKDTSLSVDSLLIQVSDLASSAFN